MSPLHFPAPTWSERAASRAPSRARVIRRSRPRRRAAMEALAVFSSPCPLTTPLLCRGASQWSTTTVVATRRAPPPAPRVVVVKAAAEPAGEEKPTAAASAAAPKKVLKKKPVYSMKKGQIVRVEKEKYLNSINYLSVGHPPYYKGLDYIYENRGEVLDIRVFETGEYALIAWVGIPTPPAWLPTYMLIKSDKLEYERI